MGRDELLRGLTPEQIRKVKACKSSEELMNLAKQEGYELTDEQLETISGAGLGMCSSTVYSEWPCPVCGTYETEFFDRCFNDVRFRCRKCNEVFYVD